MTFESLLLPWELATPDLIFRELISVNILIPPVPKLHFNIII